MDFTSKFENGSNGSDGGGNTKPPLKKRASSAKRWCFTWNNYPEDWMALMAPKFHSFEWIVGIEVGESGTKHLQGYVEFDRKLRPIESLKLSTKIHWEVARGNRKDNAIYCSKDGEFYGNIKPPKPLKIIEESQFYNWQKNIIKIIDTEPDDRTIYWFWEDTGNVGKSAFCKYLCAKRGAIMCSGKATDMKHMIVQHYEKLGEYPELILFDIPRTSFDYLSYTGMEEIKNGCFHSSKYEGGQVVMNCPHIICFANCEPDSYKMSEDRWKITKIQ